jgi:glycosyltransferase involved in cell wall biosynthesis
VISNGVDSSIFSPAGRREDEGGNRTIMFIGHPHRNKGSGLVVEAINRLASRMRVEALVVTQNKAYRPELGCRTIIVHPVDDHELADCYRRARVFVFASLEEGFGLPPLEAMACGTAVVCSKCGGVEDYAVDGVNCLKVAAGNAAAIEAAIAVLLDEPELESKLVENGLTTARSLSWDKTVESYSGTFRAVACSKKKRS